MAIVLVQNQTINEPFACICAKSEDVLLNLQCRELLDLRYPVDMSTSKAATKFRICAESWPWDLKLSLPSELMGGQSSIFPNLFCTTCV